jgi:hypothetical protein
MLGKVRSAATAMMWLLAVVLSVAAARYFLVPVPLLQPPLPPDFAREPIARALAAIAPYLYANHRGLLLAHIAGESPR